jgi:23S rRNA pseudouridine1911/1915/1917 synthase
MDLPRRPPGLGEGGRSVRAGAGPQGPGAADRPRTAQAMDRAPGSGMDVSCPSPPAGAPSCPPADGAADAATIRFDGVPGQRLDVFLAGCPGLGLSRTQVQRLCRAGRVLVGGSPARSAQLLRGGERITVALRPPEPARLAAEDIPLAVVHEDAHLIVVDKPRGLVVHPAPGNPSGTLVNALLARCPDLRGIGGELRPGVVHRLDKDTTGLMVLAKDEPTLAALSAQIARRQVSRRYLALVHGSPPDAFVVDAPIGRDPVHRRRMSVRPAEGRPARTRVEVRRRLPGHALVEVALETGRTHQIRVHLAFAGFPVVADPVYGRRGSDPLGLAGQALHAHRLAFTHPVTGEPLAFEAPLPADFAAALERLEASPPRR